jgi:acyl-CoA synthetase (AMP-forming)/AMP-acid ligase II
VDDGAVVGAVLSTSTEALACLVGAWRAGLTVVSLPLWTPPLRGYEYRLQIETLCGFVGAELLLVDSALLRLFARSKLAVAGLNEFESGHHRFEPPPSPTPGSFVQFTSGTTATPKGVGLSLKAVAANVLAILEALSAARGETSCSWLPLSHDLGLVGMCLVPWVANSRKLLGHADVVLLPPRQFASWLATCADTRATFTAAPNFGLALARRLLRPGRPPDLSQLRACIIGGEIVHASTLTAFAEAAAPSGLRDGTLCPGYGLAEATLGVSMVRPGDRWKVLKVDAEALARGDWQEVGEREVGREVVSSGRALPGVEVRSPAGRVGPIEIRSPSLMAGYLGGSARPASASGWYRTHDLGRVIDDQVYVVGRMDDMLIVGGKNVYAHDLESVAVDVSGMRPNAVVAIDDDDGRYELVLERRHGIQPRALAESVRAALVNRGQIGPSAVVFVRRGSLPKTPSGKLQRHRIRVLRATDALDTEATVEFRSTPT